MKRNIYKTIAVTLLLLGSFLPACNDYLSIAPENDLIKEKFWAKKEDADGGLAAAYDAFRDAAIQSFVMGEVRADIATFDEGYYSNYARIAQSDITSTNGSISWSQYYNAINLANTLMYFMPEVVEKDNSFTEEMRLEYTSEALFLRALSYFYLVRVWKEVPLVVEASISDQGDLFLPKSSEKEVIAQIIEDLHTAKEYAVTDKYKSNPVYYKGRANKYSILALLADVYLWDEQYEKCIETCDEIMGTGNFALENTNDYFYLYFPGNSMKESLFEIQFDAVLENQQNPILNEMIPYNSSGTRVNVNDVTISNLLNKVVDNRIKRMPMHKYQGIEWTSSTRRSDSQRDVNFIYYRYADVILMKAEALTEIDQLVEANALVRQTKERSGLIHVDILRKTDLRQEILDERGREFMLEGKRWFDILRNAKRNEFQNKSIIINMILSGASDVKQRAILRTKVYDTMSYYLPIPENELLYNPNLDQNPFYDR